MRQWRQIGGSVDQVGGFNGRVWKARIAACNFGRFLFMAELLLLRSGSVVELNLERQERFGGRRQTLTQH